MEKVRFDDVYNFVDGILTKAKERILKIRVPVDYLNDGWFGKVEGSLTKRENVEVFGRAKTSLYFVDLIFSCLELTIKRSRILVSQGWFFGHFECLG